MRKFARTLENNKWKFVEEQETSVMLERTEETDIPNPPVLDEPLLPHLPILQSSGRSGDRECSDIDSVS